ncbi:NACHT domain-containing NTPase [Leptolyngbya sp. DQ-M1]|uniref:NACHT domain-containing NTPase n=1 Tax=Leptolyngbya sp. DQ-M1 TaxID=2933920 RepID=UPI003298E4C5
MSDLCQCCGERMDRGIRASIAGIETAKQALKLKGWTQEYLAGASDCSRQTLNQFFKGNAIEKRIFRAICTELELQWDTIAEIEPESNQPPSLDELVEAVRVNLHDTIQNKCGSMRVLDMSQPLTLNAIYTAVNILEKITARRRLEMAELLQTCSLENFDRFSLGGVQEERVPGLQAVSKYSKLMILGKPGAGKTTFLKYLAIQCIDGAFKKDLVPLFITLKDFAEAPNRPSLLEYLIQLFESYGIAAETKVKMSGNATPVELLLRQGRILVLLDGLDEVRETDSNRVLNQIREFATQFSQNPFVITCRIAAREYTFERFTEVEVADFDDQQIATFTSQWFQAKNDSVKAEKFIKKLEEEDGIRELATSPLLLTLLCLVFEEAGSFPANRSELYKEGLDVLLKKWDVKRNIERDQVYHKLSLKRKEDLLSQIALDTFKQGNYFFKQKDAERYITRYIRNLPNASQDEEALQLDSEAVLKSIEAQHGLFVERARGIYSFSHLTFHEYFTARKIVTSADADSLLLELTSHITDKRWREVFLLTVGMLENADALLQPMKQGIDRILAQDEQLQQFLNWVEQKSGSVKAPYKPAAIRAFYFALDQILDLDGLNEDLNLDLTPELDDDDSYFDCYNESRDYDHERALEFASMLDQSFALNRDFILDLDLNRALNFAPAFALQLYCNCDPQLYQKLQQLKDQLPVINNLSSYKKWWEENGGGIWNEELRETVIQHRNIGYNWRLTDSQLDLLKQYHDANCLLVDCLNSDCYVSREVREEIEDTLLLPLQSSSRTE